MGLLTSLFRAATPENPSFGINSPEAWDTFLGDSESSSGVSVNSEKALTYSPWWRGINLIANTISKTAAIVYRREGTGKVRATDHPAYRLLLKKPNPFQTAFVLKRQLMGHAICKGNGYAFIERRGDGLPMALWPLDPDQTTAVRKDGKKVFEVENEGITSTLSNEDVLHIFGFSNDGLSGCSVVDKARESIGFGVALRTYGAKLFKNGARPSTVLETPNKIDAKAAVELRESWERMHGGLDNAHRTAVLHSGLVAKILSFNARDTQFIEERQFEIREIANWLGLPPHKLCDITTRTHASLEEENDSVLDDCYDPWMICWEEESEDKLFTEEEKLADSHLVEFDRKTMVRGNLAARTAYHRAATGGRPWETPNEARAEMGLNPDSAPESDEILTPLNMGKGGIDNEPEDKGGPQPGNPENNQALAAAHRTILADTVGRMVRRIGTQAEKATKSPRAFEEWSNAFQSEHQAVVREALKPIGDACELLRGDDRQGCPSAWILPELARQYSAILDTATAKTLAADVTTLNARLADELPQKAIELFLAECTFALPDRPPAPVINVTVNNEQPQHNVTAHIAAPEVNAPITVNVPKNPTIIQAGRARIQNEPGKTTVTEQAE